MYCTYGLAELVFNFYLYCSIINYSFHNNTSNKKEKRLASLALYIIVVVYPISNVKDSLVSSKSKNSDTSTSTGDSVFLNSNTSATLIDTSCFTSVNRLLHSSGRLSLKYDISPLSSCTPS